MFVLLLYCTLWHILVWLTGKEQGAWLSFHERLQFSKLPIFHRALVLPIAVFFFFKNISLLPPAGEGLLYFHNFQRDPAFSTTAILGTLYQKSWNRRSYSCLKISPVKRTLHPVYADILLPFLALHNSCRIRKISVPENVIFLWIVRLKIRTCLDFVTPTTVKTKLHKHRATSRADSAFRAAQRVGIPYTQTDVSF
jgi:hypothetical protein